MKKLVPFLCLLMAYLSTEAQLVATRQYVPYRLGGIKGFTFRLNGNIYYNAEDSARTALTWKVSDLLSAPLALHSADTFTYISAYGPDYAELNGKVYISGHPTGATPDDQLFEFDGVNKPKQITNLSCTGLACGAINIVAINGKIYFGGTNDDDGTVPYEYDPATGTTKLLGRLATLPDKVGTSNNFVGLNGKVYFTSYLSTSSGYEIWMYDPATGAAPTLAHDLYPGYSSGVHGDLHVINNKIYFFGLTPGDSTEIFEFDGTNPPTAVTNISGGSVGLYFPLAVPSFSCVINDDIYFSAAETSMGEFFLWKFNTTSKNVTKIPIPGGSGEIKWLTPLGGGVLFSAKRALQSSLWYYRGIGQPDKVMNIVTPGDSIAEPSSPIRSINSIFLTGKRGGGIGDTRQMYKITLESEVAVEKTNFNGHVVAYPNPANTEAYISITMKDARKMNIYVNDVFGKTVYTTGYKDYPSSKTDVVIPMGTLAPATYFYSLKDEKGDVLARGQIVKQ